jgi:hypothetical protein
MNVNQQIDEFLQTRRTALENLEKSVEGLYQIGVRFFNPGVDGIPEISAAQNLLPRFEKTLEDWEWKVIYNDGTELDENGMKQSHYGDIDQSKLVKVLLISNFEIDTTNEEKRAIITLDFKEGTFDFLNCGPMEVRGKLTTPSLGDKKLILFKRNRESFTAGVDTQSKSLTPTGEKITYKRYYLGYEMPNRKIIVCAYPNGDVQIEE